jgi:hypothetical protein
MPLEINPELLRYIKACKEKGFEDFQIRIPLLDNGWELHEVQKAFEAARAEEEKQLKKKRIKDNKIVYVYKNSFTIHLDSEVAKIIEKRAKKNILTAEEQIEDIIRRSCVNLKKKDAEAVDNVDDLFLKLFSRKNTGRPRKG